MARFGGVRKKHAFSDPIRQVNGPPTIASKQSRSTGREGIRTVGDSRSAGSIAPSRLPTPATKAPSTQALYSLPTCSTVARSCPSNGLMIVLVSGQLRQLRTRVISTGEPRSADRTERLSCVGFGPALRDSRSVDAVRAKARPRGRRCATIKVVIELDQTKGLQCAKSGSPATVTQSRIWIRKIGSSCV